VYPSFPPMMGNRKTFGWYWISSDEKNLTVWSESFFRFSFFVFRFPDLLQWIFSVLSSTASPIFGQPKDLPPSFPAVFSFSQWTITTSNIPINKIPIKLFYSNLENKYLDNHFFFGTKIPLLINFIKISLDWFSRIIIIIIIIY
jgi:hypothetical protein